MQRFFGLLALMLVCLLTACGGDDDDDNGLGAPNGSAQCADRTGAYRFKFAEKSGDCGPLDDQLAVVGGQSSDPPGCTGGQVESASDSCLVSIDQTCASADGTSQNQVGQVRWSQNGESGAGTLQFTVSDAAGVICQSIYDLTVTR
jgi:hypothetical protein